MNWTVTHNTNIIPNLDVMMHYNENNELQFYEMLPLEGYVIRICALDEYVIDEEGNRVLNENDDKYLVKPWRTLGGATTVEGYDWEVNSQGFIAETYFEGILEELIEVDIPVNEDESDMLDPDEISAQEFMELIEEAL